MKTSLRPAATPSAQRRSRPRVNDRPYPKTRPSGQHPRRQLLRLAVGAAALSALSRTAVSQAYPSRPITMIMPLAAGNSSDALTRILAERMTQTLRQPIIVENVTGADGSIGTGRVARAKPDGYTILEGGIGSIVFNAALRSLPYDVFNDFEPIAGLATTPFLFCARKTMLANGLPELISWLKANPNKASAAISSPAVHLVTLLFRQQTGTQFSFVPYRGTSPAVQDLVAGHIDLACIAPDQLPLVRAGSIKAYAATSDERLSQAPDIPTFAEMGLPVVSCSPWVGFFAPKGTPREIIAKLNAAAVEALGDPVVRSRLSDLGWEIFPRERQTAEALGAVVKADAEKWLPLIKGFGIKPASPNGP
jgi:tripartite-type tricarboxylate transporter receptor subunit TctC